jgi:hypothetical protein
MEEGLFDFCHAEYKKRKFKKHQREPPFEATKAFWEWITNAMKDNASFGYIMLYFTGKLARLQIQNCLVSSFVCTGPFDPDTVTSFQKELSKQFPGFDCSCAARYKDTEYGDRLSQVAFQIDWSTSI